MFTSLGSRLLTPLAILTTLVATLCSPLSVRAFPAVRYSGGSDSEVEPLSRVPERIGRTGVLTYGPVEFEPIFIDEGVSEGDWTSSSSEHSKSPDWHPNLKHFDSKETMEVID